MIVAQVRDTATLAMYDTLIPPEYTSETQQMLGLLHVQLNGYTMYSVMKRAQTSKM